MRAVRTAPHGAVDAALFYSLTAFPPCGYARPPGQRGGQGRDFNSLAAFPPCGFGGEGKMGCPCPTISTPLRHEAVWIRRPRHHGPRRSVLREAKRRFVKNSVGCWSYILLSADPDQRFFRFYDGHFANQKLSSEMVRQSRISFCVWLSSSLNSSTTRSCSTIA